MHERFSLVERDVRDHAKSISAIATEVAHINDWRTNLNLTAAREDERDKSLYRRLDEIDRNVEAVRVEAQEGVKGIRNAASRVQWIVVTVVIGAVLTFIIRGGLVP